MGNTSSKPTIEADRAPGVEIRVRELDTAREPSGVPTGVIRALVLAAVMVTAGVFAGARVGAGWVPADDGTLSQSALRVMQGQLPHRDFADIYTGGLSLIHALAFRAFGIALPSLRICVFLFFLSWVPVIYYIALRFTSAAGAGLVTLLAVAWSFPNYPAAMPSWYNLFFATFGAAALLRYLETRQARWLSVAGMCGGVSILIKVIGAYYIAGALLFLVFLEQSDGQREGRGQSPGEHESPTSNNAIPYVLFSAMGLGLFLATVIYELRARLGNAEFYQFVLPASVLVAVILLGERKARGAGTGERFRGLLRLMIPFAAGLLIPVIAFLVPYARSGALGQFVSGVTSSVAARSIGLGGVIRPVGFEKAIFALALAGLVAAAMYLREFQGKLVGASAGMALAAILVKATTSSAIVSGVWYSAAALTPLVVVLGAALVVAAQKRGRPITLRGQQVMLLISLAAMCSLVQYPFAAPIYLCYALPLTLLAGLAIVTTAKKRPGTYMLGAVAGFYLLFGVNVLVPDYVYELTHKVGPMDALRLERAGGLRVEFAANFSELVHLLQRHSPNGLMYAGNDCPELYFLSGLRNVTRDDSGASPAEVLKALQSDDLKLVVINESPFFPSGRMNPEIRAEVVRKFPESQTLGIFHVFWRP
jgi:hypothetical protein